MISDLSTLIVFMGAVTALLIVPGPDFVLVSAQAASRGIRSGVACALGIAAASLIQTALVAGGLGRIMETWPTVAESIRLAGAVYLAILGFGLLRSWWRHRHGSAGMAIGDAQDRSLRALFTAGLINNLLNPKALIFFSVFIPQFVDPARGAAAVQMALLGLLLTVIGLVYNLSVAAVFGQFKRTRFRDGVLARHGDGVIGALFLLLAGRLAMSKMG
jgi:threonine/homoserine/homoserine lactone efflux protein